jgi:DNA excision repair protein ERCC-2
MVFLSRGSHDVELVHRCIDPSVAGGAVLNSARGVVMMSGTLPPREYIVSMLGVRREVGEFRVGFREYVGSGNYEVAVVDSVTTRYAERSEDEYAEIARILTEIYLSFPVDKAMLSIFPSYSVLKATRKYLGAGVRYIMELGNTSVDEVVGELIRDRRRLIMAVAGGKLVEGVEFKVGGENLLGMVIVVGVPYPEPNDYLERSMEVLSARLGDRWLAWELTYQWPAIVRVKQAVGRAFRSEGDRAFIVLMDRRMGEGRLYRVFSDYFGKLRVTNNLGELREWINKWALG